jgi:fructose-1-phosphate kinase PfkB-like protein
MLTFTGNLLAERTLQFAAWTPGRTQRAAAESFQVGGKGINVSRMLTRLRTPNTALCFVGGAPGAECEAWLRQRGLAFRAFATARPTRSGTVVRDASGTHRETTFLGPDAPPDAAAIQACADFLATQPDRRVLAVCGSIPGWTEPAFDPLRTEFRRWLARGTLAVDTYGPPLRWFAELPGPLLFKINRDELRTLAGDEPSVGPTLAALLRRNPSARWIVSDGPNAVWFAARDHAPAFLIPPRVPEVSATGSGDVLFAGVLHALQVRGLTLPDAVAFAVPLAAANAAHPGVAEFELPPGL